MQRQMLIRESAEQMPRLTQTTRCSLAASIFWKELEVASPGARDICLLRSSLKRGEGGLRCFKRE